MRRSRPPLSVSRPVEQTILAAVLLVARCRVVTHTAQQYIESVRLPVLLCPLGRSDAQLQRGRRKAWRSGHRCESGAIRRSSPVVLRVRSLVRLLHICLLLAQILDRRILGCAAGNHHLRRVLRPEIMPSRRLRPAAGNEQCGSRDGLFRRTGN